MQVKRRRKRKRQEKLLLLSFCSNIFQFAALVGIAGYIYQSGMYKAIATVNDNFFIKNEVSQEKIGEDGTKNCQVPISGLSQSGIPTGCEAVSTVAVLNYYNVAVTVEEFIDYYLPQDVFWKEDGKIYGPNPHKVFAGTPYESSGLGCFSEVIVQAFENMQAAGVKGIDRRSVQNVSGSSLAELAETYLPENVPVIVWVTIDMREPCEGMTYYLADGSIYTWLAGEHCMVLCGMDETCYYLLDPLSDGNKVGFERELVEQRYEQMGRQAVVIQ